MGVLECYRNNCDNIMCDRHSQEHGYICNECFEELVSSAPQNIEEFMNSDKKAPIEESNIRSTLETIFPIR